MWLLGISSTYIYCGIYGTYIFFIHISASTYIYCGIYGIKINGDSPRLLLVGAG
jgi:hypothetical protein